MVPERGKGMFRKTRKEARILRGLPKQRSKKKGFDKKLVKPKSRQEKCQNWRVETAKKSQCARQNRE